MTFNFIHTESCCKRSFYSHLPVELVCVTGRGGQWVKAPLPLRPFGPLRGRRLNRGIFLKTSKGQKVELFPPSFLPHFENRGFAERHLHKFALPFWKISVWRTERFLFGRGVQSMTSIPIRERVKRTGRWRNIRKMRSRNLLSGSLLGS